ncbi:MAG TPA: hypothetical protein VN108_10440 [Marmoricola sp.]|nr:hypothetical protein [Marmoricola sp.]
MTSRPMPEGSKYDFDLTDMPELEIARDFNYEQEPKLMLHAIYHGERIRFQFDQGERPYDFYRLMRKHGAEYMPTHEEARRERWAGAPIKRVGADPVPASIHSVKGTDRA